MNAISLLLYPKSRGQIGLFGVNDNIRISPVVQVITNAGNQDSNGAIITGTLRTVFSF